MSEKPTLDSIRNAYQVEQEAQSTWFPRAGAFSGLIPGSQRLTQTEIRMLDDLAETQGVRGLAHFYSLKDQAADVSKREFPDAIVPGDVLEGTERFWQNNDGHRDAFRHAYWNALLVREYGHDWAKAFTTAHEGVPYNDANREAMDLYNNEVGRAIAVASPEASGADLARQVSNALKEGRLVVLDGKGELAWSDQVGIGGHRPPADLSKVLPPRIDTPEPIAAPRKQGEQDATLSRRSNAEQEPAGNAQGDDTRSREVDARPLVSDPAHADHALFIQIRMQVHALDHARGRSPDQCSERLAAALVPAGKANGLAEVRHVILSADGRTAFVVDSANPQTEWRKRAHVDIADAIGTSVEASSHRLETVNTQMVQRRQLDSAPTLQSPGEPDRPNPVRIG